MTFARSRRTVAAALSAALAAAVCAPSARAVDLQAAGWKFSVEGNVNVDYIYSSCETSPNVVGGGLACVASPGSGGSSSSVSNGLLPAALTFNGSTTQNGIDLGFTFGLYPGISTNDGGSPNLQAADNPGFGHTALGTAGLDIRQVFLTFGNDRMGTIMAGRNIGLFGADAILNDMTLIGVGAGNGNYAAPANTSLGSIGLGYIYTDWLTQINYTTPSLGGAKVTFGIFDPLNTLGQYPTSKPSPGIHAKIAFTGGPLYLSASGLFQQQRNALCAASVQAVTGTCPTLPAGDYDSWAFDFGGKFDFSGFELMGWYYYGKGVGTTGLYVLSNDGLGNPRTSQGFLAQVTYSLGAFKLGVNYGQSRLGRTNEEFSPVLLVLTSTLVERNDKWTGGVYYNLTKNLTVLAELSRLESVNQANLSNTSTNFNVGAFLKF